MKTANLSIDFEQFKALGHGAYQGNSGVIIQIDAEDTTQVALSSIMIKAFLNANGYDLLDEEWVELENRIEGEEKSTWSQEVHFHTTMPWEIYSASPKVEPELNEERQSKIIASAFTDALNFVERKTDLSPCEIAGQFFFIAGHGILDHHDESELQDLFNRIIRFHNEDNNDQLNN